MRYSVSRSDHSMAPRRVDNASVSLVNTTSGDEGIVAGPHSVYGWVAGVDLVHLLSDRPE
jgi:hypothetical protein